MMKRKKNRKLHGSVLLTVVVVMSLLIVFLFGTLTLATAANNRAHVNYSSAQTNVTSRTVVDAAVKAMTQEPDYANYVMSNAGASNLYIPVQLSATYGGRYGDVIDDKGNSSVVVTKAGTKKFYDSNKKEWVDADVFKFTATVTLGGTNSTTSAYVVNAPSNPPSGGNGGGGFSTAAGAELKCQTSIFGGSYLNMPKEEVSKLFNYAYRTDYSNYESDTTNYRRFPKFVNGDLTTCVYLENSGGIIEDDVYIYHNLYVQNWSGFIFGKNQGLTVWGDLAFDNNVKDSDKAQFKTTMTYTVDAEGKKDYGNIKFTEIPYVYVDGSITGQTIKLGNKDDPFPFNVFCGNIEFEETNDRLVIAADIYCMNEEETSIIHSTNTPTSLYAWTGSVIYGGEASPKEHSKGSINTKGSLDLEKIDINGDVRVEKYCQLKEVTITGDLYVGEDFNDLKEVTIGGDLYAKKRINVENEEQLNNVAGTIYCNDVYVNGVKYEPPTGDINFKVPNDTRPYYQFAPTESQDIGAGTFVYKDIFGNFTLDSNDLVYYRWKDDYDPKSIAIDYLVADPEMAKDYLKNESGWPKKADELPKTSDDRNDIYYVQTIVSIASKQDLTPLTKNDLNDENILQGYDPDVVCSVRDIYMVSDIFGFSYPAGDMGDGVTQQYGNQVLPIDASANKVQPIDSDIVIYPKYAERHTILGLEKDESGNIWEKEGYDPKNKPEGQIVKTVEDIPAGVFDIYDNEALSPALQSKYDVLINHTSDTSDDVNVYTSPTDTLKATGNYVEYFNQDYTADGADHIVKYKELKACTEEQASDGNFINNNVKAIYINKDCIIDGWIYGNNAKNIIFDPGTDDMLVVIRNFSTESGVKIFVDDSQGGNVHFYIEPNVTWSPNGVPVITTSYQQLFNKHKTFKYKSPETSGVLDLTDYADTGLTEESISPNVYIYGGVNSEFYSDQFACMTAYILSPNLKVTISAGADIYGLNEFYYHDVDIKKPLPGIDGTVRPFLIGALNAKNVSLPNTFNVVYISRDAGEDIDADPYGSGSGRYNIMYYDEY